MDRVDSEVLVRCGGNSKYSGRWQHGHEWQQMAEGV